VEVEEEVYNQDYGSLRELLESLKYTGTRGDALRGEIFWTPGTIAALGKIYKQRFRKLTATYQIFFCRGVK
jgi:hypothetical protein